MQGKQATRPKLSREPTAPVLVAGWEPSAGRAGDGAPGAWRGVRGDALRPVVRSGLPASAEGSQSHARDGAACAPLRSSCVSRSAAARAHAYAVA